MQSSTCRSRQLTVLKGKQMNSAIWVFIIVAALLVSPVLRLLPTAREKQQMKLRQQALALGMKIQLTIIPSPRGVIPKESKGVVYRLPRASDAQALFQKHTTYQIGRIDGSPQQWHWYNPVLEPAKDTAEKIIAAISKLPEDVCVIESNPLETAAYWTENGTIEDVRTIYEQLSALQQCELALLST
jgi:hypothetical protein